jgi:hypothetical protein
MDVWLAPRFLVNQCARAPRHEGKRIYFIWGSGFKELDKDL